MGLFKSRQEKALDSIFKMYTEHMYGQWIQLPPNRAQNGLPPWPDGPTDIRNEMARSHNAALDNACRQMLADKGISVQPSAVSADYWAYTCSRYNLGNPSDIPNPRRNFNIW